MLGVFSALARLVARFEGEVWLVSKCGHKVERRSRRWLEHHRFYDKTGLSPDHLRFCRDRKHKAPICRELGIQFFVDDRADVLAHMRDGVAHRFHFGAERTDVAGAVPAPTWAACEAAILDALDALGGPPSSVD
jgi:hypothetical protein